MNIPIPPVAIVVKGKNAEGVPGDVSHTVSGILQGVVTIGSGIITIWAESDVAFWQPFPSKLMIAQ